MAEQQYSAPESVTRLEQRAFVVGAVALGLAALGALRSPETFYPSYLMSFLLVLGLALGSLGLVMLQHLTSGHWGIIIRRPLESATRTLPLRSEEHTSELQSRLHLVCRLLLEKKKKYKHSLYT